MPVVDEEVPGRRLLYHLSNISKNFYMAIGVLRPPYRERVALSYLLLRILDTIEDSEWHQWAEQQQCFASYENFILQLPTEMGVQKWAESFPRSLNSAERELISDAFYILSQLHELSHKATRTAIQRTVLTMSKGMVMFLERNQPIATLTELNLYCFFVAGIVAELLVDLLAALGSNIEIYDDIIVGARHFGISLQKINILNDADIDQSQGRCFIWNRQEIEEGLAYNVEGALSFFRLLPPEEKEFRLFCHWTLLLGLAALESKGELSNARYDKQHLPILIRDLSDQPGAIEKIAHELFPRNSGVPQKPEARLDSQSLEHSAPREMRAILTAYLDDSIRDRNVAKH